jgi:hypothetical protein
MWSTPAIRIHLAITRKETPCDFCRVYVVAARPLGHGLDGGVADHQIDHHDHAAEVSGELRAFVHVLHGRGGDVQVVALDLPGRRARLVDPFHAVQEAVAPMHEGLGVDVLVVLREVEAAAQRFVDDAPVVAARKTQLRLHRRAQQRATIAVQPLALADDAGRRSLEGLQVGDRYAHVFQTQRLQRLEAEHIADDRRGQICDRPFLEQVDVVGDVDEVLVRRARDGIEAIGLGLVVRMIGQPVGPDHGPGGGGRFAGDGGAGFLGIYPILGGDPKHRQDVGVLRFVVGRPVAHLLVLQHARPIAILDGEGCCVVGRGHDRALPCIGSIQPSHGHRQGKTKSTCRYDKAFL